MAINNFLSLFSGGTKNSELADTRERWQQVESKWRASPLSKIDTYALAVAIVQEAVSRTRRPPIPAIIEALCEATEVLLQAEDIEEMTPAWTAIESDLDVAVRFREMLSRRLQWATDFPRMEECVRSRLVSAYAEFFDWLPENCFVNNRDEAATFDVPLVDLLENPGKAVQALIAIPYDDEVSVLNLFRKLREVYLGNLLHASGLSPKVNHESHEYIFPTDSKEKRPRELAELYLSGTPFSDFLDVQVPLHIPEEVRFEHCHIIGGTGHGKTQLMQRMIFADLEDAACLSKRSIVVLDSQGDLIQKLLHLDLFSPEAEDSLAGRLVVIDPSDVEYPASLNLFDAHLDRLSKYDAADRERVLNGVVELYELFFGAFLGAELTQRQGVIFKYLARLMLAIPNATIHTLMQVMEDGKAFKPYMDKLDGSAKRFFETEFFDPSFSATKKQIVKRLWGVLSTPAFDRMFSQTKNRLDLFDALNDGKIILINTAKDFLKREGSELFGRFFIAMLAQAALERSTLPEHKRTPVFVYVDEAHEYFDDSVETILNQARKYRMGLTLAHQTLDQLSPRLRAALFANTSMKCVGGVSAKDASPLAEEMRTTAEFIEGMRRKRGRTEFALWVRHLTPRAIKTSVPLGFLERQPVLNEEDLDAIIAFNRVQYCGDLHEIRLLPPPSVSEDTLRSERVPPAQPAALTPIAIPSPPPIPMAVPVPPEQAPLQETRKVPSLPSVGRLHPPVEERETGKGGPKHRYLQALVKELAEAHGFRATVEAPISGGQVDVLLQRDGFAAAFEISVTTPIEYEKENVRKCLARGFPRVAVVLIKSKSAQEKYRAELLESVSPSDRSRLTFLTPEGIADYIAALVPPRPEPERMVKGYRVGGSIKGTSPDQATARREAVARLIARSLARQRD